MVSMSRSERAALCNAALEAGEYAPTLCGRWTVKDLVIHLLQRERDPVAAPAIVVPPLEPLARLSGRRLARQDFTSLVERVRKGPPSWSPLSIPPVERAANTLEFFVHHEDIRRAAPGWEPRELTDREQRTLWKAIRVAGKGLARKLGQPLEIHWVDGERSRSEVLRRGPDPVVVTGPPSEITLCLFGRAQHRGLEFSGPEDGVRRLRDGDLSV